jgi:hypothetical protein
MLPSAEAAVMLLVVLLYLQDSLLLLYDNEGVMETGGKRYRAHLGARTLHLAGRSPFLPNPLIPWRPIYRLTWSSSAQSADHATAQLAQSAHALRPIGWWLVPIAAGLFVGLPLCLYFNAGWRPFLMLVGVMYTAAATTLWLLWRRRAVLALDGKRFALICAEALLCLPCALNLVRKVSTKLPVQADFVEAARAVLHGAELQRLLSQILRRVDEQIEDADAGGSKWQALMQYRARLAGLMT